MTATDLESRCERPSFRSRPDAARAARSTGVPVLDIVVPVYNEQTALADSVHRLYAYLGDHPPADCPHLLIPLHTVIELTPGPSRFSEERFDLDSTPGDR